MFHWHVGPTRVELICQWDIGLMSLKNSLHSAWKTLCTIFGSPSPYVSYALSSIDSRNINNKFPSFYFYFVMDIKGDSLLNQIDRVFTNTKLKESHKGSTKTLDTHKNSSYSQVTPNYFITTCCK